jgi:hypothetical protein
MRFRTKRYQLMAWGKPARDALRTEVGGLSKPQTEIHFHNTADKTRELAERILRDLLDAPRHERMAVGYYKAKRNKKIILRKLKYFFQKPHIDNHSMQVYYIT